MRALILLFLIQPVFAASPIASLSDDVRPNMSLEERRNLIQERIQALKEQQQKYLTDFAQNQIQKDYNSAMELTHSITILEDIETQLKDSKTCEDARFAFLFKYKRQKEDIENPLVKEGASLIKKFCNRD